MPALSLNKQERDHFFASLPRSKKQAKEHGNRRFSIPASSLRQKDRKNIWRKNLDMLEEIQKPEIYFSRNRGCNHFWILSRINKQPL